jgi:hypothetical protein
MNSRSLAVFATLVLIGVAAPTVAAHAFDVSGVGGKLGYTAPDRFDGTTALGAHVELEQSGTRFHLMPNVMYWKVNGVSDVEMNLDGTYHFNEEGAITPYVGAGLGLNSYRSQRPDRFDSTDLGLNLLAGVRFPGTRSHYFVEGRYNATDVSKLSVLGGITFHVH